MHSSLSISSISSTMSNNSSIYGSQTILNADDLLLAAPRCRSSLICSRSNEQSSLVRIYNRPSIRAANKCRHLFHSCLSSTSYPLSSLIQQKLSDSIFRKEYFTKLCRNHRLLFVLNDYQCKCGCHFSMKQGTFVILYEKNLQSLSSWNKLGLITVISNQLVCSKVPSKFLCDINVLRERVRTRCFRNDKQSFDL